VTIVVASKFIMSLNLTSSYLGDHFLINIDNSPILVSLDSSIDIMGGKWVSFGLHSKMLLRKNVSNSLTLSLEFLLCINPAGLSSIQDLSSCLTHGVGVSGTKPPLWLGTINVISLQGISLWLCIAFVVKVFSVYIVTSSKHFLII